MPAYNTLDDHELLKRLQTGDEKAFTAIYNRYWEKLLAIGLYFSHNKQASEDIVHEVMIGLWERKSQIKIDSLEAYLAVAIKFAVFKTIAREKRRRDILEGLHPTPGQTHIEASLDAKFLQEYLRGAVNMLPEKARLVFTYSRHGNLSVSEIAGRMDLSPKAVEYHLTKALRALKEHLKKIKSFFI